MTTRDAGATRDKLLQAARDEFSAHGIAGSRVDRIALSAGVNKQRIYGYYGSKERLFAAVLATALDELADTVGRPGADIGSWVGSVHDFHRANPQLLRLLMWEALQVTDDEQLPGEPRRVARYAYKVEVLADRLGLPAGPEVATTLLCLIGLAVWPNAVPGLTRQIVGPHVPAVDLPDTVRAAVVALAESAVARVPVGAGVAVGQEN